MVQLRVEVKVEVKVEVEIERKARLSTPANAQRTIRPPLLREEQRGVLRETQRRAL